MKKIFRMIIFSTLSIYITSLLIKGFIIKSDLISLFISAFILAIFYYLLTPLMKLILLPLNFFTLGLASTIIYVLLFNYVINKFNLVLIKPWIFPGINLFGIFIPKIMFNYWLTLITSSIFYSSIINFLELIL
jgi:uncharacterized membrane protein YvlD (DUF360 family)